MRPPCTGPVDESDAAVLDERETRSSLVPQDNEAAIRNERRATRRNRDIRGVRCKFHAAVETLPATKKAGP